MEIIKMKKILIVSLLILFGFTSVVFADPPQGRGYNKNQNMNQGDYSRYYDYKDHKGYRSEPYNRGLHYHEYSRYYPHCPYLGHWNSWDNWNRYYSTHPCLGHNGRYERYNGQLYFFFNDGFHAFGFSIGGIR